VKSRFWDTLFELQVFPPWRIRDDAGGNRTTESKVRKPDVLDVITFREKHLHKEGRLLGSRRHQRVEKDH